MAESFIGRIVNLVSKSEIRYEGVVSSLNATDSTIGLQNVKSYGTEGRRTDGPQIPPSDSIHDYILFRGSDIKDLQVKAIPAAQPTSPTLNDPAIIEMHCLPTTMPPMPKFALVRPSLFLPPQPSKSADKSVEVAPVSSAEQLVPKSQPPMLPFPSKLLVKSGVGSSSTRQHNRGGSQRGRENMNFRPAVRFAGEYDFEAMNEKFNKEEIWGQLGKSNEVEDGENDSGSAESEALPVYAKHEFFDSLSCPSLNGGWHNQKIKYSERVKLDIETFGYVTRHEDGRSSYGAGRGGYIHGRYMGGRSGGDGSGARGSGQGGYIHGRYMGGRGNGYNGRGRGHPS